MTYGIEKDEEGNEALFMNATVRDNIVELDWVRDEDDAETYAQRGFARFGAIANSNSPLPPQSACLMMRLNRQGNVEVSGMACTDEYREQAIRLAKEAVLDLYDSVFPDIALKAREFVEESIGNVKRLAALDVLPLTEEGAGKQLAPDQFLPHLLDQAKAELEKTGEVVQRIGWLVNNGMALVPAAPPFEQLSLFSGGLGGGTAG
jgi:hypothetical protein